jgi:hypothetical protein
MLARKLNILLCRLTSPAAAETERAAGGYTVGGWATNVDDPRRGGAPIWAPLPTNATGEIYGQVDPGAQIVRRLGDHRARFFVRQHQGSDVPDERFAPRCRSSRLCFGNMLPYSKHYGVNYLRPAKGIFGGKRRWRRPASSSTWVSCCQRTARCVSAGHRRRCSRRAVRVVD